jgi:elongation factor P
MERHARPVGGDEFGGEGVEMGLVARRPLQDRGFDLDEVACLEVAAQCREDAPPRPQEWLPVGMDIRHPPGRGLRHRESYRVALRGAGEAAPAAPKMLARGRRISMLRASNPAGSAFAAARPMTGRRISPVKVIASSLRKGNIVELEGKLYVILTAENIHPGKGTPVTQLDMRRISDGVKSSQRYKTTDQVERAHVEDREFQYLYQDADGHHFMNMESYDQIAVSADILGDQAAFLQPEMKVHLATYEGVPVSIQLPPRVVLEVVETEPTTRGQTAASSYKPAKLSNGLRTNVPPHIVTGTRIVVSTEDASYVERAKD